MKKLINPETIEKKLPLLAVENNCIISKFADITACFRLELPEIFTLSTYDHQYLHKSWVKAIRLLPNFSIVHKQDWFIEESYEIDKEKSRLSFLSNAFERHFYERPYLNHYCYVFVTKSSAEQMRSNSFFSSLTRSHIIPKKLIDKNKVEGFLDSVAQFEKILSDTQLIKIRRLTDQEILGSEEESGIIEKYLSISQEKKVDLEDIDFSDGMKVGDKYLGLFTLSDVDHLPSEMTTDFVYDRLSTDKSKAHLGFSAPLSLLLPCNHIYNQYVFIEDPSKNLKKFESSARNLNSLSIYSRENAINKEWIDQYLNEAISFGLLSVSAHANVFIWSDNKEKLKNLKNLTSSAISSMDCRPHYSTIDAPTLFWTAIPGNAGDFPSEETYYTFLEQATCFFNNETNYKSSLSPFGIKMVDRMSGKPILLDISDEPMKKGIITNRNKFILGPSGSGKSFFTNHMVRQYYEQGTHVLLVDTGNSYLGLCQMIQHKTHGKDGVYYAYTEKNPISFNPFHVEEGHFDIEKKESIKALILTLWKRESESPTRSEEVALSNAINLYLNLIVENKDIKPCFNTFYEFLEKEYKEELLKKGVREKDFDLANFLNVLEPYYRGGEYDYLLNSEKELDLLNKRFIVFELDNIKDHKILFPVVTLIIMETFISKMRKLKGIRKMILIEEAWKAIAREGMAEYIKYLFKTVRKFFGEAIVVTQEVDDIIHNPIVKDTIINNSDCKILLDQRKYLNKFESIQSLLGLSEKEKDQILSINLNNNPNRNYKEVWIGLGGTKSAVYATEVSSSEYYAYTTEETEKMKLFELAEKKGGDIELAIKDMAEKQKNN